MRIYQGEPLGFKFNIKDDEGHYYPSLADFNFEALLANCCGQVVKKWSTLGGSITTGVEIVADEPRGFATFSISGKETAELDVGEYIYEMASVLDGGSGRVIGKLKGKVLIEFALIRNGV